MPYDLDLHCCDSTGNHVYFSNKVGANGKINLERVSQSGAEGTEALTATIKHRVHQHHHKHVKVSLEINDKMIKLKLFVIYSYTYYSIKWIDAIGLSLHL